MELIKDIHTVNIVLCSQASCFLSKLCFLCSPIVRGRHASKITEEEEDEECLKEEEDGISGTGNTRLLVQPSCKIFFILFVFIVMNFFCHNNTKNVCF